MSRLRWSLVSSFETQYTGPSRIKHSKSWKYDASVAKPEVDKHEVAVCNILESVDLDELSRRAFHELENLAR